jgi:N utilization substance protein B
MALSPQKYREMVFQILFSEDTGRPDPDSMTELMMAELAISKKNVKTAQDKVKAILQKLPEIDPLIASVSTGYDFNRIQTVAKNILRLGVFELLFDDSIPPKVAIAEAMRLARKFGTKESASFVNALLDHLYRISQGDLKDAQFLEDQIKALEQSETNNQAIALEINEAKERESSKDDEGE